MRKLLLNWFVVGLAGLGVSQAGRGAASNPEAGPHLASQAAADVLREAAGTDGAFIAARSVSSNVDNNNLAAMLQFPTDDIVVVKLSGRDLRAAFERSISLYPQPNSSFLQLSGFVVEFTSAGAPESRVMNVSVNGSPLDENRTYSVAMPGSLGRGGMGYFKIWDKQKIERTLPGATLESVLKGKKFVATPLRWVSRS